MDTKPSIGCVIATPGRKSLLRTLYSISYQGLEANDDILVVGDGHHGPIASLVAAFGHPFRYLATQRTATWGHDQANYGLKIVKGDVLVIQDDDDVFAPRAFDEIRKMAARFPNVPIIGRVKTPNLGILWEKPGAEATLDGHCLVVPNNKKKLGFFTREYNGDQAYMKTSLEKYEEVYWADRVWSITRPTWKLWPFRRTGVVQSRQSAYATFFLGEHCARLTDIDCVSSDHCWMWWFYPDSSGPPIASVEMYQDDERMLTSISFITGNDTYLPEIAEFIAWAGQGLDVWVYVLEDDIEVIEALTSKGYKQHGRIGSRVEYIHDWPPRFFEKPQPKGLKIVDPRSG